MFLHSLALPVLSLSAFTLLYDHTCIRNGQLAVTSQVAANFLPLNFKVSRHIKFAVSSVFFCVCAGPEFSSTDIFKCESRAEKKKKEKKKGGRWCISSKTD